MTAASVVRREVRPIEPADAVALVDFHEALDRESQYRRFFNVHPHLSDDEVAHFTRVDHTDREALVVVEGERIVGVGRYDRSAAQPSEAEVAFVVACDRRGEGIATGLLHALARRALAAGISTFTAETLGVNHEMRRVFADAGYPATHHHVDGVVETRMDLTNGGTRS